MDHLQGHKLLDSTSCVLCNSVMETYDHLFFSYNFFDLFGRKSKLELLWLSQAFLGSLWFIGLLYTFDAGETLDMFYLDYPYLSYYVVYDMRGIIECSSNIIGIAMRLLQAFSMWFTLGLLAWSRGMRSPFSFKLFDNYLVFSRACVLILFWVFYNTFSICSFMEFVCPLCFILSLMWLFDWGMPLTFCSFFFFIIS